MALRLTPSVFPPEPFPPEDLDRYVALRAASRVPIAAGENEFGVQGFREVLRARAIHIAQPDACRTGGISEVVAIAAMALALSSMPITPTNCGMTPNKPPLPTKLITQQPDVITPLGGLVLLT